MYTFTLTDEETQVLLGAMEAARWMARNKFRNHADESTERVQVFRQKQLDAITALEAKIEAEIASQRKPLSEPEPEPELEV
jgi:hypothetical protein